MTYAYDGSGVELRAACTVVEEYDADYVFVEVTDDTVAQSLRLTAKWSAEQRGDRPVEKDGAILVHRNSLSTNRPPRLASFNWLD